MEGESINHADNSVGRSQPEALIIHTYTFTHRSRVAVLKPCSQQKSHHHKGALAGLGQLLVHAQTYTYTCVLVRGDDLFQ